MGFTKSMMEGYPILVVDVNLRSMVGLEMESLTCIDLVNEHRFRLYCLVYISRVQGVPIFSCFGHLPMVGFIGRVCGQSGNDGPGCLSDLVDIDGGDFAGQYAHGSGHRVETPCRPDHGRSYPCDAARISST